MAEPVLIDTGPLVALFSARDRMHAQCSEELRRLVTPLYTCWPVLTEAAYLLRDRDLVERLLAETQSGGLSILPLTEDDVPGTTAILSKYADQDFDLADACLMHLSEREDIGTVFTLDKRDFSIYRRTNGRPFKLLP